MSRVLSLIILCTSFSVISTAQTINELDAYGRKQGFWKKEYANHALKYEGTFVDDIPIGKFIHYHENDAIKAEIIYSEAGVKNETVLYNEKGKKVAEGMYIDQRKDGIWFYYDDDTQLLRMKETYRKGIPEGEWIIYYDDGKTPSEIEQWKEGKKEGLQLSYFDNGQKKQEIYFEKGKPEGVIKYYHRNGTVRGAGQYVNNEREGVWIYYDEAGKRTVTDFYESGELIRSEE